MSARKINVAIVGLGFGAEFIPIYQRHPQANMYAICQRTQKKLEAIGGKLAAPRRAQISQADVGGHLAFGRFKRVISRAEVPRQTLLQLWIDVPNQHR